jgi:putative transposase
MMQQQGQPSLREMCRLAAVSRAAYHRHWDDHAPREQDTELRSAIQEIALGDRHCGYRRIHEALKRRGWAVNHKRVLRLMREDNLLALRHQGFVTTTDGGHDHHIYPNLTGGMRPSAVNQLWVADITYIQLREEFIYAAIVMDAYSRRIIGWAIERNLQASLAVHALEVALQDRVVSGELIHHSDRGVQYACAEYVLRLQAAGIQISMSRRASPWDNARAESFMKTLKAEAVDGRRFRNLEEARSALVSFIQEHYNARRLHSALGYCSPLEFEQRGGPR